MKNIIFCFIFIVATLNSISQDKAKLSFELGYGRQQISMCNLNNFYLDNFAIPREIFQTNLTTAKKVFMGVRYQPSNYFDFGFYCNGLKSVINGTPSINATDNEGFLLEKIQGTSNLFVNSFGYGITTNIHLNYFLKLHEKQSKFLNRIKILGELNMGQSIASARGAIYYPLPIGSSIFQTKNIKSFESQFSIKFQYDYIESPILSGIGIKLGYQYLKTKTLKDQFDKEWIVEGKNKINLDFGGYFAGFYLILGK